MGTFVWDEDKRLSNLHKHAIDFRDAVIIFDGVTLTIEDDRFEYPEHRFISLGLLRGHVIVVFHAKLEEVTRIISARKTTSYEREIFFRQIND